MGRLEGKVAIITGAAAGLGQADAARFIAEGARVVITDIAAHGLEIAGTLGPNASFVRLDVADEGQWQSLIEQTESRFGRLDVLVNNAAINAVAALTETSLELWQRIMTVNAAGTFLGCKWALPAIERSGGGSIINMSSVAAMVGIGRLPAYSASKGAIAALTKSVAVYCNERRNGVRCNSVHPDGVRTDMLVRLGAEAGQDVRTTQALLDQRMGDSLCRPEDVAALLVYLASDESYFVNGAEMCIDNAATHTYPGPRAK